MIFFFVESLILHLSTLKIDFFKLKMRIFIAIINNEICFVKLLKNLYNTIFFSFDSFFFSINCKFFKKIITNMLEKTFIILKIFKFSIYANFFFRTNVVILVKQADLLNRKIQLLNRWKFNVFDLYIHNNINIMLNCFKKFQKVWWVIQTLVQIKKYINFYINCYRRYFIDFYVFIDFHRFFDIITCYFVSKK